MRFAFTILLVGILFLSFVTVFHPIETCSATGNIIYVDDGNTAGPWNGTQEYPFQHIQGAIDTANESDIIYVYSGIYNENVVISKTLTLTGEDKDNTIIEGDSTGHIIEITANSVNISGFKIRNAVGSGYDAIMMSQSQICRITNNIIENSDDGIYLLDSDGNTISWNTIKNNNANGIGLSYSSSNTIQGNTIQNNDKGITLHSSSNNVISGNTINGNNLYGVHIWTSANSNNIVDNTISDNGNTGIYVASSANNNDIYHNSFLGNTLNAYDTGSNNWDDGSEGNYWDDYTGYDISGGSNQDRYPLGFFQAENQKPIATITSINPTTVTYGETVYFSGKGEDSDSGDYITAYKWRSSIDGQLSTSISFSTSGLSIGTHAINFSVKDNHDEWSIEKTAQVVVNQGENQIPTAIIVTASPSSITYGEKVYFHGYGIDTGGMITEYSWRSNRDGILSNKSTFNTSSLTVGLHTIYFKVRDNNGDWSDEVWKNVMVDSSSSANEKPVAKAGGPYLEQVNVSIGFNGSGSSDDGTIIMYKWDFGDGTTETGESPTHIYNSTGNYTISLTVTDDNGETSTDTTYANITLQSPDQNGNGEEDDGFPGFELIFAIIASVIVLFWIKKRKGS